ncbi:thap domain-containing protein 9-like protein [Lasius niger]|uniref:Thap domain-containing protein 9-like protein n=1 Tax=Lasius niger TaxID=67767 RepID=A0A0J7K7W8_LASNI|nr:thap domain-containing protein 9-like protein [Lasius niger]
MKTCSACGYWKETNEKNNISFHVCNINCNVEKNNAIVKFGNKCLEGDTTESNIVTEITSCANDTITIDSTCQMEAEDTYKKHPGTPKRKLIRQRNPRYVGDCALSDFQSPRKAIRNWKIALSYIDTQHRKLAAAKKQEYRLRKKVTHLEALIRNLKSNKFLSDDAAGVVSASISESSKAIFNRQLNKKSRKEFPQVLRTFATTLQFYSNRAYNYVRKTFMNSLPHPETIRKWYQKCDGTPSIIKESIDTLKLKICEAKSKGKILYFNLVIDEMCIKRKLDWDGKRYTGFVDSGTNIDTNKLPEAQYALVFLVTCVTSR